MIECSFDPPLPHSNNGPFLQHIRIVHEHETIGQATWHTGGRDGVVQLIDLWVADRYQRQGNASRLLESVIAQSAALFHARQQSLRRIWTPIEQKSQVIARSFLTRHGFHHIATIADVLKRQDILIYVRSFD